MQFVTCYGCKAECSTQAAFKLGSFAQLRFHSEISVPILMNHPTMKAEMATMVPSLARLCSLGSLALSSDGLLLLSF